MKAQIIVKLTFIEIFHRASCEYGAPCILHNAYNVRLRHCYDVSLYVRTQVC